MNTNLRILSFSELDCVTGAGPSHSNYVVTNANGAPVTQSQLDQLDKTLNYLSGSPTALQALTAWEGHAIVLNTNSFDYAKSNGVVGWDPYSAIETSAGQIQSAAIGLAHEIGGHEESTDGFSGAPSPVAGFPNMMEYVATQFENRVAAELGEPQRSSYDDVISAITEADPTAHGDYATGDFSIPVWADSYEGGGFFGDLEDGQYGYVGYAANDTGASDGPDGSDGSDFDAFANFGFVPENLSNGYQENELANYA